MLNKNEIVESILQATEFTIDQKEKVGFFSPYEAHYERCRVEADRVIANEINNLRQIKNKRERDIRIVAMRKNLDQLEKTRMTFFNE